MWEKSKQLKFSNFIITIKTNISLKSWKADGRTQILNIRVQKPKNL